MRVVRQALPLLLQEHLGGVQLSLERRQLLLERLALGNQARALRGVDFALHGRRRSVARLQLALDGGLLGLVLLVEAHDARGVRGRLPLGHVGRDGLQVVPDVLRTHAGGQRGADPVVREEAGIGSGEKGRKGRVCGTLAQRGGWRVRGACVAHAMHLVVDRGAPREVLVLVPGRPHCDGGGAPRVHLARRGARRAPARIGAWAGGICGEGNGYGEGRAAGAAAVMKGAAKRGERAGRRKREE